jgi:hypothetical protein
MSRIVRLSPLQTTVPTLNSDFQRVFELGELCDLEFKLANLLVGKLRHPPAGRASGISHAQDFYEFL